MTLAQDDNDSNLVGRDLVGKVPWRQLVLEVLQGVRSINAVSGCPQYQKIPTYDSSKTWMESFLDSPFCRFFDDLIRWHMKMAPCLFNCETGKHFCKVVGFVP